MRFLTLPSVLHVLLISSSLILSLKRHSMKRTSYEAPHCAVLYSLPPLPHVQVQIFSTASCFQTSHVKYWKDWVCLGLDRSGQGTSSITSKFSFFFPVLVLFFTFYLSQTHALFQHSAFTVLDRHEYFSTKRKATQTFLWIVYAHF
jgi:hypothetical protein